MNINKLLKDALKPIDLPVEQDEYTGAGNKYLIFVYEDERPEGYADNKPIADTTYLQLQLVTPKNFDYFALKDNIKKRLEAAGFRVTSTRSFLGDVYQKTEKKRQTIYELTYTQGRTEE